MKSKLLNFHRLWFHNSHSYAIQCVKELAQSIIYLLNYYCCNVEGRIILPPYQVHILFPEPVNMLGYMTREMKLADGVKIAYHLILT